MPDCGIQIADGRGVVLDQVTFGKFLGRNGPPVSTQLAARAPEIINRARASVEQARTSIDESQKLRREVRKTLDKSHAELRTLFRVAAKFAKLTN